MLSKRTEQSDLPIVSIPAVCSRIPKCKKRRAELVDVYKRQALETVRALESQMMMRQYKGFLE